MPGSTEKTDESTVQPKNRTSGRSRAVLRKPVCRKRNRRPNHPIAMNASDNSAPATECGAKIANNAKPSSAVHSKKINNRDVPLFINRRPNPARRLGPCRSPALDEPRSIRSTASSKRVLDRQKSVRTTWLRGAKSESKTSLTPYLSAC